MKLVVTLTIAGILEYDAYTAYVETQAENLTRIIVLLFFDMSGLVLLLNATQDGQL